MSVPLPAEDLNDLYRAVRRPLVHPNGFIILAVPGLGRVHVWPATEDHLGQTRRAPVHDHVFDMTSRVIAGVLYQVRYDFVVDRSDRHTHRLLTVPGAPGREMGTGRGDLVEVGITGCLVEARGESRQIRPGRTYTQPAFTFHDSVPERRPVITWMTKDGESSDAEPFVAIGRGRLPDNDFSRDQYDPEYLWGLVEEAWNDPGHWDMPHPCPWSAA